VLSYIRKTAAFWQRLALSLTRNLIREVRNIVYNVIIVYIDFFE